MQSGATPARSSPLAYPWNAGGWFGSQLGGTAWLFVAAGVLASQSPRSALVVLACGLAANAVGSVLWMRRRSLDPYRALQGLAVVIVLCGGAATRWLELQGEFGLLDPRVSPRTMYLLLASLALFLVALFEQKRRAARAAA
jgi:hypothetical protein